MRLNNSKRLWKMSIFTLIAVLCISVLAACGNKEKVVATYTGGEITQDEFNRELGVMSLLYPEYASVMDMDAFKEYLIKQQIASEYLYKNKVSAKEKEEGKRKAEEQLKAMKASVSADQLKKMLDAKKLTEQNLDDYMIRNFAVVQYWSDQVKDDEIKAKFEQTKDNYTIASVRHVLIAFTDANNKTRSKDDALKLAKEVKAKLDNGADFAAIAKQYSDDPGSKDKGGLYENTPVGNWVDEFKKAALTLPLHKISDPIETQYGYHIMRVESRKETKFEDLTKDQIESIRQLVGSEKMDKFIENDLKNMIKKVDLPKSDKSSSSTKK
ncbi:peptidylprolyl isomerase [Paenibacillus sediminis]|uniref:Foldase protein PrsA n=1 Tax=Paenibacillus sediminis TaxID=664909 RepID=A0ABS4H7D7_9BACL|nr:peptidylprolyl isomerase [Paenibacillus sediminis]MBP1938443.1 foldase protein PrsA [Paenibacillus sediminis]